MQQKCNPLSGLGWQFALLCWALPANAFLAVLPCSSPAIVLVHWVNPFNSILLCYLHSWETYGAKQGLVMLLQLYSKPFLLFQILHCPELPHSNFTS